MRVNPKTQVPETGTWGTRTPSRPLICEPPLAACSEIEPLFAFLGALHDCGYGFARGFAVMEDGIYLSRDGEFNVMFRGEGEEGGGGTDTFGDGASACQYFRQGAAFAKFDAQLTVAA
jgi:hypothetical protein